MSLSEVVCINADKGLFHAKVLDSDARRKLLDSAKNLKNSAQFSTVYINKDLTYRQRQTLIARRMNVSDSGNRLISGTVADVAGNSAGAAGGVIGGSGTGSHRGRLN